ncbi:hypothetical protein Poli38472_008972 [Pythium oligandrum]|uniref:Selenoprotein O n=1 Tax=Pythium oligandrum TaxID=41045 RepID=A0A8K1CLE6_PYTOL|nr:hypothetical protein Poli38472_008972 [Pythium oligandrum]|eukprot:TMW64805.1 hypothetical protein Poli38472_008972 [Pythium oligandrum]
MQCRRSSSLSRGLGLWRKATPSANQFDNAVLRGLPMDKEPQNVVRSVVGACFSRVSPTPIEKPELVIASTDALRLVGIQAWKSEDDAREETNEIERGELTSVDELVPFLCGNTLFSGSETAAQCYCGHQFGYFSGQLGDGAAVYLGEVVNESKERWELQLKGSGLTPFSRSADGRKVLRSSLREFLASEHMHALGIPTTRSGSVVVSHDTQVVRDMFYDGNAKKEPTAVITRIARTFLRFGSFEIFKEKDPQTGRAGPSAHLPYKKAMMRQMVNFTIRQYFPDVWARELPLEESIKEFFDQVVQRTAKLVAQWQCVGFCHGVLNTDNMSIVGDTLDYGPYGFMEHFNPGHICNTSDDSGRYRYEAQPEICKWNCTVLADQLGLVMERSELDFALDRYDQIYQDEYYRIMREKLGLIHKTLPSEDKDLIDSLMQVMAETGADFTCTFRALVDVKPFAAATHAAVVYELVNVSENLTQLKRRYSNFTEAQYEMVAALLEKNPVQARMYGITIETFEHMTQEREKLAELNRSSDAERHELLRTSWAKWMESYVARLKEETDSQPAAAHEMHRRTKMLEVNPLFVLRNHVAQKAIDAAIEGDYDEVAHIFDLLTHPFDKSTDVRDRLRFVELKLFREAATQLELPRIVMNLVFTSSDYDDAYTRKVLAHPTRSYYTGFVNSAFASVEEVVAPTANRVRRIKAEHLDARREIARKIIQHTFLLWKQVHANEKRIGLNAQLCIKRAARMAFQSRPVWAGERLLIIFSIWARWTAFSRCKRLGIPMPQFAQTLPQWELWLHNYQERQIRKVKAAAKGPLAHMRRCFRRFRVLAAYALKKRLNHERAVAHFGGVITKKVLLEWRAAIAESAYHKKLTRSVLTQWHQYAHTKRDLRPRRRAVVEMRLLRDHQRAWTAWRDVQLRSCFKRELNRARLEQPQWRWKMQRVLLVWMDVRTPLHKWRIFVAWKQHVQRRKLFLALCGQCSTLRRRHLVCAIFRAWKAVVWKQEDEFLEDRLQLSAWDAYEELAPMVSMLFYGHFANAAAVFAGVPVSEISAAGFHSRASVVGTPVVTVPPDLVRRQQDVVEFHHGLAQGSVVEARNLIVSCRHLVNAVDSTTGNTPLHVVAQVEDPVRRLEIFSLLLSEGAVTWDRPNRHGLTPKQLAPDETSRELLERGLYAFHARDALRNARKGKWSGGDAACPREARLLWCIVSIMSSEYVCGDRIPGDIHRAWHSVLRDELWLRQGRIYFASTSSFAPSIQRCRAFLNGMKRRICLSKDDVLHMVLTHGNRPSLSNSSSLTSDVKPMTLIKSATRRMLSRDLAKMEEKVDLLSWLTKSFDEAAAKANERSMAQEHEAMASVLRQLGELAPYGTLVLSPILQDEAAEQPLIHSFVGVLFNLRFDVDEVLQEVGRLEDDCVRLENDVMQQYQAILREELRTRSPDQPLGLPLLRLFGEDADADYFFKRELLLVNMELYRRNVATPSTQEEHGGGEDEEDGEEDALAQQHEQLSTEVDLLLVKAQRKLRKVDKKIQQSLEELTKLETTLTEALLSTPRRLRDICTARMKLESERLLMTRLRIKQLDLTHKIREMEEIRDELKSMGNEESGNSDEDDESQDGKTSRNDSETIDALEEKRDVLEAQLLRYLSALRRRRQSVSKEAAPIKSEIRCLHQAASRALWALFIRNLFRSCCCWLVENMWPTEEMDGDVAEQTDKPGVLTSRRSQNGTGVFAHAEDEAVENLTSRRRSSLTSARKALETLHRSSLGIELAELNAGLMNENYASSSHMLFAKERAAARSDARLHAQLEQQQKSAAKIEELNPITKQPETLPPRLVEIPGSDPSSHQASGVVQTSPLRRNRKKELIRQAMQRHREGDTHFKNEDGKVNMEKGQNRRRLTAPEEKESEEAVVYGEAYDFGNFVISTEPIERELSSSAVDISAVKPPGALPVVVAATVAAASAESLWRRGNAVRRPGEMGQAGRRGSSFDLFASAEDEMAFDNTFRLMSASKDRRTTPSSQRGSSARSSSQTTAPPLSTTRDTLSGGYQGQIKPDDSASDVMVWVNPMESDSLGAVNILVYHEGDEEDEQEDALPGIMTASPSAFEDDGVLVTTPAIVTPLPALRELVSESEEAQFFNTTLKHYLLGSQSESSVPLQSSRSTLSVTQPLGGSDGSRLELVQASESHRRVDSRLSAPLVKWEYEPDEVEPPSMPSQPPRQGLLRIESTRLLPESRPQVEVEGTQRLATLNLLLEELRRREEDRLSLSKPEDLRLSGTSVTMKPKRAQHKAKSDCDDLSDGSVNNTVTINDEDGLDALSLLVPKVTVAIQRKESPQLASEVALTGDSSAINRTLVGRDVMAMARCELRLNASTNEQKASDDAIAQTPKSTPALKSSPKIAAKQKKRAPASTQEVDRRLVLQGARFCAESSAAPESLAHEPDRYQPTALTKEQKAEVWRNFTLTPLSDTLQNAYAELYPRLYTPTPSMTYEDSRSSTPSSSLPVSRSTSALAPSLSVQTRMERDKRFWSAVEGYKVVGKSGLVPIDEKTLQARRVDAAVRIFQEFLQPNAPSLLSWLHLYPDEVRSVQQKLLRAPRGLFQTLQETARLQLSMSRTQE